MKSEKKRNESLNRPSGPPPRKHWALAGNILTTIMLNETCGLYYISAQKQITVLTAIVKFIWFLALLGDGEPSACSVGSQIPTDDGYSTCSAELRFSIASLLILPGHCAWRLAPLFTSPT